MHGIRKCDVCDRPARFHETCVETGDLIERHFCGTHSRKLSLAVWKDLIASQAAQLPKECLPTNVEKTKLKKAIKDASSLKEVTAMFHFKKMAKRFQKNPPNF
jgi:hypothetical protein